MQNTNIYTPETKINNKIPLFNGDLLYINKTVNSSDLFNSDKFYLLNNNKTSATWAGGNQIYSILFILDDIIYRYKVRALRSLVSH